jgi:hypothetical protein
LSSQLVVLATENGARDQIDVGYIQLVENINQIYS